MENMNLASRCREAIAQVAALKKEIVMYQKRQSEWGTLQREVMALRKQIDKNAAISSSSNNANNNTDENDQQELSSAASSPEKGGEEASSDLDRIMSQHLRKQSKDGSIDDPSETAAEGEKNPSNSSSLGKKFQDLRVSSATTTATSSTKQKQQQSNTYLTSSNTKIPISVNSASSSTNNKSNNSSVPKDDEFDADIDMVDFFAKSQLQQTTTSSTALPNKSKGIGITDDRMPSDVVPLPGGASGSPGAKGNSGSPNNKNDNVKNKKSSSLGGGDNLLMSSLDAFEASFASAFPETSFSITSSDPSKESMPAKLDMSFDVPDFDPFFKSPHKDNNSGSLSGIGGSSKNNNNASSSGGPMKSQMMQDVFPESAMTNFKTSTTSGIIPPKLDDIMTFDSNPMSSFAPMEKNNEGKTTSGAATAKKGSKGKGSLNSNNNLGTTNEEKSSQKPLRLGNRSSQPLSPLSMSAEIEQLDVIANLASSENTKPSSESNSASTTPTASSTSGNSSGSGLRSTSRKVKQPISYAEPSTKSKLRRGDVLFPKVDVVDKKNIVNKGGRGTASTTANEVTTDLDRIMGQM